MKPTQQEIIELAREANMTVLPDETLWWAVHQDELERFATLLLERFGAGGGEPVAYDKTALNAFAQDLYDRKMREGKHGHYESMYHVIHQCIARTNAHPSPTDLRAEYLRGLEDAAGICDRFQHRDVGMQPAECASAIRALKGKQ